MPSCKDIHHERSSCWAAKVMVVSLIAECGVLMCLTRCRALICFANVVEEREIGKERKRLTQFGAFVGFWALGLPLSIEWSVDKRTIHTQELAL